MVVALPAVELGAVAIAWILLLLVSATLIVFTPVLHWVGNQIPLVGGWASSQLLSGITYIHDELQSALNACVHLLVVTIGAIAQATEQLVGETLAAVQWTVAGIDHLATAGIHAVVAAMIAGLIHGLHALRVTEANLAHYTHTEVGRLGTEAAGLTHTVYGDLAPALTTIENVTLPGLRTAEAGIQHELGTVISPELARIAAQVGALGATVATVEIGLRELEALRCSNVGTLARFLCGLDPAILALLLNLAGDALVLELLSKAGVSLSDAIGWTATGIGDLEQIVSTF